jgi:hypothetical protein
MARERWFYEQDNERRGPFSLDTLVDALRTLPEPRNCLVWKHGMPAWTLAAEVPEIEQLLPAPVAAPPPVVAAPPASFYAATAAPAEAALGGVPAKEPTTGRFAAPAESRFATTAVARPPLEPEPARSPMVYVASAAALLVVAAGLGWALLSRSASPPAPRASGPATGAAPGPAAGPGGARAGSGAASTTGPAAGGAAAPPTTGGAAGPAAASGRETAATRPPAAEAGKPAGFAGWSDTELPLPASELGKLRGVAGWSGNNLSITLYNGSTWRVTELLVRTSRLEGDKFVDAPAPSLLLPVTEQIDTGIADILKRVAPDRRKPGINPLDTGAFEAKVGPQPEAYRWKIEGAKGYPPRGES